jgi:hypothetical protein
MAAVSQLKGAFPYRRRPRAVDAAPCPSAEVRDFRSYHARIINSGGLDTHIESVRPENPRTKPMNHGLKKAAPLLVGAAMLTACAGLNPPQQAATDPAYQARLDQFTNHRCNDRTAGALQGAGIAADSVTELYYTEILDTTNDRISRYIAWMRLAGQPGQLVVENDGMTCRAIQIYTRYGAKVEGVSSY